MPLSVAHRQRANDLGLDQADELVRAGIIPAEVLPAVRAHAMRPRMARKPGMFKSWHAGLPASQRLQEGNDFEMNAARIGKREFVPAIKAETILFVCNPGKAPRAKPIAITVRAASRLGCFVAAKQFPAGPARCRCRLKASVPQD